MQSATREQTLEPELRQCAAIVPERLSWRFGLIVPAHRCRYRSNAFRQTGQELCRIHARVARPRRANPSQTELGL